MILITGASGRVARRTAELASLLGLELRLMSRNPQRAPKLAGAEVVRGDFANPATLDQAFAGIGTALVVSGHARPGERARLHRNAFEAAARAGVGHVIYISLQGSSPGSKYPYSRDHDLSEQCLAASGIPFTVLRNAFYIDMFLERFDAHGIARGPANGGRGAFVSREDCARVAAAVLAAPPGGTHDVTGPEALSVADVAGRLGVLAGRELRFENESVEAGERRMTRTRQEPGRIELDLGWYEAIAAGELQHVSDAVRRFTGREALSMEEYFTAFPHLLDPLRPAA
ncbi:MAG TPA: NAD(P)H-binding protein [Bryobacteraceae bacterium]|nr:NAD(P)H-binding protein [Bryobacteraceae bacterium]